MDCSGRASLILSHTEIACKMAKRLLRQWNYRMENDEAESHAYVALCEAAHRFDPLRGCKFSSFFYHHLRGHLLHTLEASASDSRLKLAALSASGQKFKKLRDFAEGSAGGEPMNPDFEISSETQSPEDDYLESETNSLILLECGKLSAQEQEVLRRMFQSNESPAVAARSLGLSRRDVLRIRERAIEKLRKAI